MSYRQPVNVRSVVVIGAASVLLLAVGLVGLEAWYKSTERAQEQAYHDRPIGVAPALQKEQQARLSQLRWLSREQGVVVLPIEQAMRIVRENGGKLPATQPTAGGTSQ